MMPQTVRFEIFQFCVKLMRQLVPILHAHMFARPWHMPRLLCPGCCACPHLCAHVISVKCVPVPCRLIPGGGQHAITGNIVPASTKQALLAGVGTG
eukprot:483569-Pelagomonas_calceolata.AAC.11